MDFWLGKQTHWKIQGLSSITLLNPPSLSRPIRLLYLSPSFSSSLSPVLEKFSVLFRLFNFSINFPSCFRENHSHFFVSYISKVNKVHHLFFFDVLFYFILNFFFGSYCFWFSISISLWSVHFDQCTRILSMHLLDRSGALIISLMGNGSIFDFEWSSIFSFSCFLR